jgi:hypothetical protein
VTETPDAERYFQDALRFALRSAAEQLERIAADWEATAANDSLHTPPAVVARTAATAGANRTAAGLVRGALAGLDDPTPPTPGGLEAEERPYARSELLYAVTRGDAEAYLQERLGEDEAPTDDLTDAFAAALQHTIDGSESWGDLLEAACDAAWAEFAPKHGLLEAEEAEDA